MEKSCSPAILFLMNLRVYGFRTDNLRKAFPIYLLLLISFLPFFLVLRSFSTELVELYHRTYPIVYLSILGSIAQELFFRSWLIHHLKKKIRNPIQIILINSALFAFMHVFIPLQYIFIPVSFIMGIGFAAAYYYYPNIYLVSAVHIIVNLMIPFSCLLGLIQCP